MTRKTKIGWPSNRKSYYSVENGDIGWHVFLNGNPVVGCVTFDTRRGFVKIVTQPPKVVNKQIATHKLRGRVSAIRIKQ